MPRNEATGSGDRYEDIRLASDETVIYDVENRRAWIQSDRAVDPEEMA